MSDAPTMAFADKPRRTATGGDTVVAIDPPGRNGPLYQREHFRKGAVRWRKVERFLPDEEVQY